MKPVFGRPARYASPTGKVAEVATCLCGGTGHQTRRVLDPANPSGPLLEQTAPCPICRTAEWSAWWAAIKASK